jgi:hypothetical protein
MRIAGAPDVVPHTTAALSPRRVEKSSASSRLHGGGGGGGGDGAARAQSSRPQAARAGSPFDTHASHFEPESHFETAFVAQVLGQIMASGCARADAARAVQAYADAKTRVPRTQFIGAL